MKKNEKETNSKKPLLPKAPTFYDIIIVGGGASGLIAAISAISSGHSGAIAILERMDRVGKKILSTGNGRCNFTNIYCSEENFHGKDPSFVNTALSEFTPYKAMDFFEELGVISRITDEGKVYPYSLQASSVLDVLRRECSRLGITSVADCAVKSIEKQNKNFILQTAKGQFECKKLIIACGGCAAPKLGSDGSGFKLLRTLGHSISKLSPALVQLKSSSKIPKMLDGIKIFAKASLICGDKIVKTTTDEVLFREYGLSGPAIFQISCLLERNEKYIVSLDLMPDINKKELFDMLKKRKENLKEYCMEEFFTGMINKKAGFAIAKLSGIEKLSMPIASLDDKALSRLCTAIKALEFEITGTMGFDNAQVTAGGVYTSEFDASTMESKKQKNLFCAGEIFDIYGDCGGFNLQWAWASGYIAGKSAAEDEA